MIPSLWAELNHFSPFEFEHPEEMEFNLMAQLDVAREIAGIPFRINSSHRPGDLLSHGKGMAVDIECLTSRNRFHIVQALLMVGFTRIGVYDRHIHADIDPSLPQDVMWWGRSK